MENKIIILEIIIFVLALIIFFTNRKRISNIFSRYVEYRKEKTFQRQKAKNWKIVRKIVLGSMTETEKSKKVFFDKKYRNLFFIWQDKLKEIFDNKSERQKVLNSYASRNKIFNFKGIYSNTEKPKDDYEIVLENCFSDSFPSLHDMDNWARKNAITLLMIMLEISPSESKNYYFHEKRYFVNHGIVTAIFIFDLYKRKK